MDKKSDLTEQVQALKQEPYLSQKTQSAVEQVTCRVLVFARYQKTI